MGRGRQKAKQTKVARDLKYNAQDMDIAALQRELSGGHNGAQVEDADDEDDGYGDSDRWARSGS